MLKIVTEWPSDQVTEWPSDRVTEWPSDQVTKWPSDRVTKWPSDQVTKWPSDRKLRRRLTVWYISKQYQILLEISWVPAKFVKNWVSLLTKFHFRTPHYHTEATAASSPHSTICNRIVKICSDIVSLLLILQTSLNDNDPHREQSLWHSIMSLEWIKARASVAHHSRRDDGASPEVRGGRLPLHLLLQEQAWQARLPQTSHHLAPQQVGQSMSAAIKHNTIARRARIRKWQALGSDSRKRKCGKWEWGVQFELWWGQRTKRQWYKGTTQQCTVKHHTDIINFACMTWNFVRISASLSAQCKNFYLFDIGIAFLAKFYPILM